MSHSKKRDVIVVFDKGWYIESDAPKIFNLYFEYDGKRYHRRLRLNDVDTAKEVLLELKKLFYGGSSSNSKALIIYNSLDISKQRKDAEYTELLDLCDREYDLLYERMKELEEENFRLRSQLESISYRRKYTEQSNSVTEMWEGEMDHFLYQAAKQARMSWVIGDNHRRRGVDVLDSYLAGREESGYPTKVCTELYNIFSSNLKFEQIKSRLSDIGIECEIGNNNHYHIYPIGHPEYRCVLSSTPSDNRAYTNGIKKFIQVVFK